ncbi:hypothetical protein [Stenotrophomonas rhizophila]|uniref:hypothetical protein n=1 Tax=Stenotrophomonas rhizophila TaxID=216778 RepID=UPI001E3613EA|nr:hypothetical protein [Stenotrophomonas rhizophila]
MMRNASVVSRRCGARPRLASPAALLLLLPMALAASGAQAQAAPETTQQVASMDGQVQPAVAPVAEQDVPPPADAPPAVAAADAAVPGPAADVVAPDAAVTTVVEPAVVAAPAVEAPPASAPVQPAPMAAAPAAELQVAEPAPVAEVAAAETPPTQAPAETAAPIAAADVSPPAPVAAGQPAAAEPTVAAAPVDAAPMVAAPVDAPVAAEPPAVAPPATAVAEVVAPAVVTAPAAAAAPQIAATAEVPAVAPVAAPAPAAPAAAAPQVAGAAEAPAVAADAAALPARPPAPRAPAFVNDNNAIERQLGARCPNDLAARMANQGELLIGACQGTMPAHLAALLVAIPEQQIHLPRAWRERQVAQRAWFKAVPGQGQRPDFLAVQGGIWVRSFEGADAATTVYLVSAPFDCADGRMQEIGAAEPQRLPAGSCRQAFVQERVFRVSAGAAPVDITAEAMPARPTLSEAEKKRYEARGGHVVLDHSKLQFGPAMRWHVHFDGAGEISEARGYGDWGRVHLGFVAWDGQRFVQRDTLPRSQWPCDPVAPGDRQCGGFADAGRDPFVVADARVQSQGATP